MSKISFINRAGEQVSADIGLNDYRAAAAEGRTLSQYLEMHYGDQADTAAYGSVFDQACQSIGVYQNDPVRGLSSPTVGDVVNGKLMASSTGSMISPDGLDTTPAGRILFPEIIMGLMRTNLIESEDDVLAGWDSMIAVKHNIQGDVYVQPKIDTTANEDTRMQVTSQLALPPAMVNITTSQVTKSIPTKSVGLMISEQAMNHTSLDLIGVAVAAQSRGERIQMAYDGMTSLLAGDIDAGMAALSVEKLQVYDSAITGAGEVTHKAFLHQLYDHRKTLAINSAIMDIDTYLAYQNRAGAPTIDKAPAYDERLTMRYRPLNYSLTDLNILLVDNTVYGANTGMFFDSRFGISKTTNVNASYEAIESYVMRRATGLRLDFGSHYGRIYDSAFKPISLTV